MDLINKKRPDAAEAAGAGSMKGRDTLSEGPLKVNSFFDKRRQEVVRTANAKGDPTPLKEGRNPRERPDGDAFLDIDGDGYADVDAGVDADVDGGIFDAGTADYDDRGFSGTYNDRLSTPMPAGNTCQVGGYDVTYVGQSPDGEAMFEIGSGGRVLREVKVPPHAETAIDIPEDGRQIIITAHPTGAMSAQIEVKVEGY